MSRIVSRHIFIHVAITTVILTFVLVFGAWLTQSLRFIEVIVEQNVSIGRYLSMVWLLLPNLASIILPICTLLATVYTLYKLISDNEMVVYKAVGLSNIQIAIPVIIWGILMTGICAVLNNYLGPRANEQFYGIRNEITKEFSSGMLREGVFNKLKDAVIYVGAHTDSGQLEGIYIYGKEQPNVPGFTIYAQHGFLHHENERDVLYLFNGNRQTINPAQKTHSIAYFNEFKYDLDAYRNVAEKVKIHMTYSFFHLVNPPVDVGASMRVKMLVEAHKRLLNPLFVIVFVLFSSMVLLSGQQQRHGRWKRIVSGIGFSLLLELAVLGILNTLAKNSYAILLSYLVTFIFGGVSLVLLIKPEWVSSIVRRRAYVN